MIAVGLLRLQLLRLHAAAEAAIAPGMSLDTWYRSHFDLLVAARVDGWTAVARDASPEIEQAHVWLRAEFYPREDQLLARAEAASLLPKSKAPRRGDRPSCPLSLDTI